MTEKNAPDSSTDPESLMNGAAIVLADGREVPITDKMVHNTLEKLVQEEMQNENGNDANSRKPASLRAPGQ